MYLVINSAISSCRYWVVVDSRNKKKRRPWKSFPSPNVPQHVGFLACLCDTRRHENYELILCCFPNHLRVEVKNDIASSYDVVSLGEGTSLLPLNKGDWASFHLPEMYTLLEKENNLVRYVSVWLNIITINNSTNDLPPRKLRKKLLSFLFFDFFSRSLSSQRRKIGT